MGSNETTGYCWILAAAAAAWLRLGGWAAAACAAGCMALLDTHAMSACPIRPAVWAAMAVAISDEARVVVVVGIVVVVGSPPPAWHCRVHA